MVWQAYGPKSSSVTPLLAKDGSTHLKSLDEIMRRWHEHFSNLFHNPLLINVDAINSVPQRVIHSELDSEPTLNETIACIVQREGKEVNPQ